MKLLIITWQLHVSPPVLSSNLNKNISNDNDNGDSGGGDGHDDAIWGKWPGL